MKTLTKGLIGKRFGKRFGKLFVLKQIENNKHGHSQWLCLCDCGNKKIVLGHSLKGGSNKKKE